MASFTKINDWILNAQKAANVATDQFAVALSNTAPGSESTDPTGDGDGILGNVTEVSYTNCSSRNLTTSSFAQSSGTAKLTIADLVLTASGGSVGPFRYVYVYDDTVSSPADPLVAYFDYGSSITLADGETLTLDFDNTNGLYQAA